jgi:hypothetical protein
MICARSRKGERCATRLGWAYSRTARDFTQTWRHVRVIIVKEVMPPSKSTDTGKGAVETASSETDYEFMRAPLPYSIDICRGWK